jgi:hypothetical protein
MAGFRHFLRTAQNWPFLCIFTILITFVNAHFYILLFILYFSLKYTKFGVCFGAYQKRTQNQGITRGRENSIFLTFFGCVMYFLILINV